MAESTALTRTLEGVNDYLFARKHEVHMARRANRELPRTPISSKELIAGLLLKRPGDRTAYRIIDLDAPELPDIEIAWATDGMLVSSTLHLAAAAPAVHALKAAGMLERIQRPYVNEAYMLSTMGKLTVVREWFRGAGLLDILNAGGVYSTHDGTVSFPRTL